MPSNGPLQSRHLVLLSPLRVRSAAAMSKKQFKSQASSSRAVSGAFGTTDGAFGGGAFGAVPGSMLSYIYEPPDLSAISESNIVVAFKSLQKKDSTTKAKALEELQSYISSLSAKKDAVDDEILDAWVGLSWRVLYMLSRVIIHFHLARSKSILVLP